jgi:hypothetical protein
LGADDEALAAGWNITPSKSTATASGCPPAASLRTIRSAVGTAIGFGKPKARAFDPFFTTEPLR